MNHVDNNVIDMSSYLTASVYHSSGVRRLARLAPQLEFARNGVSSIPRPIIFTPPVRINPVGLYPSHLIIGEDNTYMTNEEFMSQCGKGKPCVGSNVVLNAPSWSH